MASRSLFPALFFCIITFFRTIQLVASDGLAATPPRGWNSYDSFSWVISEDEFLANAQIVADKLQSSGYEYVVVDFLWFRKNQKGVTINTPGFDVIDEWGRPQPDPDRWPSTAGGKGFAPIADKVHAMGLKFGLHVMRGISTAAVSANTPIFGADGLRAKDIALSTRPCSWMNQCFWSVDTTSTGGQAFLSSLYQQYASWGVDFVKHDCVFGVEDLSMDEISFVSKAIAGTNRPMMYSLSPGVHATPSMASQVAEYVNMYRVTSDDWDTWGDVLLHFDVARDFAHAGLIGGPGQQGGRSWPDLDMLPLGWLTDPGVRHGPYRSTYLSPTEQQTQMTLWAMAKSPLMFGGDLRKIDQSTLDLITNSMMLDINDHSLGNAEISSGTVSGNEALPVLTTVNCKKASNTQWTLQRSSHDNQLCWSTQKSRITQGCMNWTSILDHQKSLDDDFSSEVGQAHVWMSNLGTACVDPHGRTATTLDSFRSKRLGPCAHHRRQMWQLTPNGKLLSKSTGLCAVMYTQENVTRIWSARGSDGEFYVALFNLGEKTSQIAVSVNKVVQGKINVNDNTNWACNALDVWTNKNLGVLSAALSASVEPHGSALYSLTCSPSK